MPTKTRAAKRVIAGGRTAVTKGGVEVDDDEDEQEGIAETEEEEEEGAAGV